MPQPSQPPGAHSGVVSVIAGALEKAPANLIEIAPRPPRPAGGAPAPSEAHSFSTGAATPPCTVVTYAWASVPLRPNPVQQLPASYCAPHSKPQLVSQEPDARARHRMPVKGAEGEASKFAPVAPGSGVEGRT
jgi:hypothetical protein